MSGTIVNTKSIPDQSEKRAKNDFTEASELVAEFAGKEGRQPRIMVLKMGIDGRDRGDMMPAWPQFLILILLLQMKRRKL